MSQAVTKEAYEAGLNCRGFCALCSEKNKCYQFKALYLTSSETTNKKTRGMTKDECDIGRVCYADCSKCDYTDTCYKIIKMRKEATDLDVGNEAITKKEFDAGKRCSNGCLLCRNKNTCYQYSILSGAVVKCINTPAEKTVQPNPKKSKKLGVLLITGEQEVFAYSEYSVEASFIKIINDGVATVIPNSNVKYLIELGD